MIHDDLTIENAHVSPFCAWVNAGLLGFNFWQGLRTDSFPRCE